VEWLERKFPPAARGWREKLDENYQVICQYAAEQLPELKLKGHLHNKANAVAREIDKLKRFPDFARWVKQHKQPMFHVEQKEKDL
jgi:hypothetical protein